MLSFIKLENRFVYEKRLQAPDDILNGYIMYFLWRKLSKYALIFVSSIFILLLYDYNALKRCQFFVDICRYQMNKIWTYHVLTSVLKQSENDFNFLFIMKYLFWWNINGSQLSKYPWGFKKFFINQILIHYIYCWYSMLVVLSLWKFCLKPNTNQP